MRTVFALLVAVLLAACAPDENRFQVTRLPSGKEVKVIGVGQVAFAADAPALVLEYETDIPAGHDALLQDEVDEIWASFRPEVEQAGLSSAIVSANQKPTGLIVKRSRSTKFVYKRKADGTWVRVGH